MFLLTLIPFIMINNAEETERNPVIDKPNIIFIMADDLGWGNVGYHNTENPEIKTPNIDYLVSNGLELNRHYVDPECSPSRTSFQSGRLPVHVNTNNNDGILDSTMGIPPDMTCIASKLKEAGYTTHMIGKWDCGFSTFKQIPISRGYDSYYGYLGKSIEYYTKKGDAICSKYYVDLWEDDHPAYSTIEEVDKEEYVEYDFIERLLNKIDDNIDKEPFFIFYSSHLPHYPVQLPPDCEDKGLYEDFDDDENMCIYDNYMVFPGYYEDRNEWRCRSILQAQVAVLDDLVGDIVTKLKESGIWDNTLIVFSTDNGGSLELDETAGNNYPLRGGKASFLEGGIRATAFVSGGYLPSKQRGQLTNGLMHIADWYATFSEMLGIDPQDYAAVNEGLPPIDGYNMWPLISGDVDESPRNELIMSHNVLIWNEWKLILGGTTKYAIWQSPMFPNASSPTQEELEATLLICDYKKNWGCLFNVLKDPGEHNDLADFHPTKVGEMRSRIVELKKDFFENSFIGENSCPVGYHDDSSDTEYISVDLSSYGLSDYSVDQHACGCWMSQHNYGNFAGPYMDLGDENINFDEGEDLPRDKNGNGAVMMMKEEDGMTHLFDIGNLNDFKENFVIYMILIVVTVFLLVISCRNCSKTRKRQNREKMERSDYGTINV